MKNALLSVKSGLNSVLALVALPPTYDIKTIQTSFPKRGLYFLTICILAIVSIIKIDSNNYSYRGNSVNLFLGLKSKDTTQKTLEGDKR